MCMPTRLQVAFPAGPGHACLLAPLRGGIDVVSLDHVADILVSRGLEVFDELFVSVRVRDGKIATYHSPRFEVSASRENTCTCRRGQSRCTRGGSAPPTGRCRKFALCLASSRLHNETYTYRRVPIVTGGLSTYEIILKRRISVT